MILTLFLSSIMMAGLFLLLLAGVGFIQDKKFLHQHPKPFMKPSRKNQNVFAVKLAKRTVKLAKRRKCMMGFDVTISATIFNLLVWIGIGAIANWDTFHSGCHSIDASLFCRGPCL